MRRIALGTSVLILIACAKADRQQPADAGGSATAVPAGMAGTWRVAGYNEAGDSIVGYQLVATNDTSGWTIRFPNRDPLPVRVVAVAGDSVIAEAGPYESLLRPGVQVRTRSTFRAQGDTLLGATLARYTATGADTVLRVRSRGTRIP